MARLRTLKPEFFTHELLGELSPLHRLLYQGLWCYADREGRLEDRHRYLKTVILPYDSCDVDAMLGDLEVKGFILRYIVGGRRLISIPAFVRHQKPHPKEAQSVLPGPESINPKGSMHENLDLVEPGKDLVLPRKGTVEPGKDLCEQGGLGDLGLGDLGLGPPLSWKASAAAGTVKLSPHPEPEDFEADSDGEFQHSAWGFWGWHNAERKQAELFDEPTPPHGLKAWHDSAIAMVQIPGLVRAYRAYLHDRAFGDKGWPFAVFMAEQVWLSRANRPPPQPRRL